MDNNTTVGGELPASKGFMRTRYSLGDLALLLGLWLVWGYSWVVSKIGLNYATALQMVQWRLLLAMLTLGALLLFSGRSLRPTPFWPTLWLGLTQTTGFTLLSSSALLVGGVGKVTILCYTMPFWTLLLARLFLQEHLQRLQWLSVLLALGGLLFILEPWGLQGSWVPETLSLAAGICWSVSAIVAKRLRRVHRVDTLALTFWQQLLGLLPLFAVSAFLPQPPIDWQGEFILILIFNGCVAAGLGWLIWLHLLSRLSAGMAGLNVLATPAVALLCAWAQLGEQPSLAEGVGMLLIALGLGVMACWSLWQERHEATMPGGA